MSDSLSDSLQSIFNNPAAMEQIKSLMGNMTSSSPEGADISSLLPASSPLPLSGVEGGANADPLLSGMMKIQQMYSQANSQNDPRMNLLSAIRPYLNQRRMEGVDSAIRILRMSQLLKVAKDANLLGQLL